MRRCGHADKAWQDKGAARKYRAGYRNITIIHVSVKILSYPAIISTSQYHRNNYLLNFKIKSRSAFVILTGSILYMSLNNLPRRPSFYRLFLNSTLCASRTVTPKTNGSGGGPDCRFTLHYPAWIVRER